MSTGAVARPRRGRPARTAALLALLGVLLAGRAAHARTDPTLLDDFGQPALWQAGATDDIDARLRVAPGRDGAGLCLDFDFHGVSGGASLRRALPIRWPAGYALSLDVRGAMPANDLQVRFIDASGDNVWWYQRPGFTPTDAWQTLTAHSGEITSAWGPAKDRTLRRTAAVEVTVYAGHGGRGELCLDNLRLVPQPVTQTRRPPSSANDRFQELAQRAPRGLYPRSFSGEQGYWTLVGVDGGAAQSALLSEDGAVEVRKGGWSIEPMLFEDGTTIDWATVRISHSLLDGYLPLPTVHWQSEGLTLDTRLAAQGPPERTRLLIDYVLRNQRDAPRTLTLALLARPLQVNPSTQFLNAPGGVSPIHDLAWDGHALTVDNDLRVLPLQPPDAFVAGAGDAAALPQRLARGERPRATALHDAQGYAQGALLYRLTLPAHGTARVALVVPHGTAPFAQPADPLAWFDAQRAQVAQDWRTKLNHVRLSLPPAQQAIADTARSAQAQMLMSRDGPALQPGTRSYARTWIRDGAMMGEALLRSGHADVAGAFVRWYAPHQFRTGKVPCCVDARGSDPVPENDSQGELLFAIAQWWAYSRDHAGLAALWPHVERTVTRMDALRESERSDANRTPARRALYGLMPASISHEGYSAKPMHSYWDDFWSLVGYDEAISIARTLDKPDAALRFARSRDAFRADLEASILASVAEHRIDYLPGAAELGDFDATSTTIALSPGDAQDWLPPRLLERTFARYWKDFLARRDRAAWDDYTPYEWRNVAAFVRLGWRERIPALLDFFLASRRPAAWNQWAEVVGRDPRKPRFVGDMPHAWIASDFLRSVYDLFAYARPGDQALVLGAGLPADWLGGAGVGIDGLRTPQGALGYRLRADRDAVLLQVDAGLAVPPGGLVFPWPYAQPPGAASLDGQPVTARYDAHGRPEWVIRRLPATLRIARPVPKD
jgi:hypothetical protein